jgi:hypothetical protein
MLKPSIATTKFVPGVDSLGCHPKRIHGTPATEHFEMQVRTGGMSAIA